MADLKRQIHRLPTMKSGDDLLSSMEVLPEYDESIRSNEAPVRLMALSDLYRIYVPSQMSLEIYSKMYLALLRSLQKKGTKMADSRGIRTIKPCYSRSTAVLWVALTVLRLLEHPV